jgi:predicted kinase
MKRLPEEQTLNFRIEANSVEPDHIQAITKKLAFFHESASVEKAEEFGSLQAVEARVLANFRETERFIGRTISAELFEKIRAYSEAFLRENSNLFRSRIAEGRVREGHGDLRAEHVCLLDDIVIFDCIEFDEALRYGDSASEIGFLSMDLDFLAAPKFSRQLEENYASQADDPGLASLLPFYKCYRAYVRGKVESLKSEEQEVPDDERRRAAAEAQRYFFLSRRYARGKSRQLLLVVCGKVGTGKSTVARMLADVTGFPVFNSDRVRKKLAGVTHAAAARVDYGSGIYGEHFNELTYHAVWEEAEKHLARGEGVIVDATFKDSKQRALFMDGAAKAGVPAYFIECRLDEETARRRLIDRAKRGDDVSDATWETYQRMCGEFQALSEIPEAQHFEIETEHKLLDDLDRLEAIL